jgi:hypothetical protein
VDVDGYSPPLNAEADSWSLTSITALGLRGVVLIYRGSFTINQDEDVVFVWISFSVL